MKRTARREAELAGHQRYADALVAAANAALAALFAISLAGHAPGMAAVTGFAVLAAIRFACVARGPAPFPIAGAALGADAAALALIGLAAPPEPGAAYACAFLLIGLHASSLDWRRAALSGLAALAALAGLGLAEPAAAPIAAFALALAFAAERGRGEVRRRARSARNLALALERERELNRLLAEDARRQEAARTALSRAAIIDGVTGIENRRAFQRRCQAAAAAFAAGEGARFAVFAIDLCSFTGFNESFGREAGDAALRAAAERLRETLAGSATLARLGADEFAVLAPAVRTEAEARALAARLAETMDAPLLAGGHAFCSGAAVGAALAEPGDHGACVLAYAAIALREARRRGPGAHALHDPATRGDAEPLAHRLRAAALRGELELAYQPIVRLADRAPCGWEALMRWNHPTLGPIEPAIFIPMAEETGAIVELGCFALTEAARDLARFRAAGAPDEAYVSVNIAARQLEPIAPLERALAAALAQGGDVRLEIAEAALHEDPLAAQAALERLGRSGARLSLDDFGVGASSLQHLQRMPFTALKIDRALIADRSPRGRTLLAAALGLARGLGFEAIAEGIETQEDALRLARAGARYGQGYALGRPESAPEVLSRIAADQSARASAA